MKGLGYIGESLSCVYLIFHGYKILERNYHSRFGEIDIIAKKGNSISFVEVKARDKNMLSTPASAVNIYKQQKIIKTANLYLMKNRNTDGDYTFDVIEVVRDRWFYKINLIKNAF